MFCPLNLKIKCKKKQQLGAVPKSFPLQCSSRQHAKTEETIHVLYVKKLSMNFAQLFPLLFFSKSLNIKYLKTGNAPKQIVTKPLLLAKQGTGLTTLQSKAKEWAASYSF